MTLLRHARLIVSTLLVLLSVGTAGAEEAPHLWHGVSPDGGKRGVYNVVIEIPEGSSEKFEVDHDTGAIKLDRMLKGGYRYPAKYGYFPRTLGADGDAMDVVVVGGPNRRPGEQMKVRIIGKMNMVDTGEKDTKIIAVPVGKAFAHIRDITELPATEKERIAHFFENYKTPDNKIVKVGRFSSRGAATAELRDSKKIYDAKFGTSLLQAKRTAH